MRSNSTRSHHGAKEKQRLVNPRRSKPFPRLTSSTTSNRVHYNAKSVQLVLSSYFSTKSLHQKPSSKSQQKQDYQTRKTSSDKYIISKQAKNLPSGFKLDHSVPYQTTELPKLSFNEGSDNDDSIISPIDNYRQTRAIEQEQLLWQDQKRKLQQFEHEARKRQSREQNMIDAAIGGSSDPRKIAEERRQQKQKRKLLKHNAQDAAAVFHVPSDDEESPDGANDDDKDGDEHVQPDSVEFMTRRLTKKQQELVDMLQARAFQEQLSVREYAAKYQLEHIVELLDYQDYDPSSSSSSSSTSSSSSHRSHHREQQPTQPTPKLGQAYQLDDTDNSTPLSSAPSTYTLHDFDTLHIDPQTTSSPIRLNPKQFTSRSDTQSTNSSSTTTSSTTATFVPRKRPAVPQSSWSELGMNPASVGRIQHLGLQNPTAIQQLAIPFLMRKFNKHTKKLYVPPTVAIQAYTGSGKTHAYGLPVLNSIDVGLSRAIPPPNVIAAIRQLQGVRLAHPPPLQPQETMADEYSNKVRIIQYNNDQTYNTEHQQQQQDDDQQRRELSDIFDQDILNQYDLETLVSTRAFLDKLTNEVDIFSLSPEQWEDYVFSKEHEETQLAAQTQRLPPVPAGQTSIDARTFNSRVYSLEALRLRRKKQLQDHLKKIFPFVAPHLLDPDAPQSPLQSIIVVPTKELALQITKQLTLSNHTVWTSDHDVSHGHQLYGDKNLWVVPHKMRDPINVRMVTGKIDPVLLGSLGVFLHKAADKPNTDAEINPYNKKVAIDSVTGQEVKTPKLTPEQKRQHDEDQQQARPHPFVEFGKGHKFYKDDQSQYRDTLRLREKEHVLRVMRMRERQLQGEKLSQLEQNQIDMLEDQESRIARGEKVDDEYSYLLQLGHIDDGTQTSANLMHPGGAEPFESNLHKLLQIDDDKALLDNFDSFRVQFDDQFDSQLKQYPDLAKELKSRLAQSITRQHQTSERANSEEEQRKLQQKMIARGLPVMQSLNSEQSLDKKRAEEVKERYLKEVDDLLLEQIGGETGDFVEVARDKQPHIIVGTPSTIVQLIKSGAVQLPAVTNGPAQLKSLVFDEIDHLARNEHSPEHQSLLELLSLPADQSVFVSASMTRDSSRLLTRLSKRQSAFVANKNPHIETVSDLLALPRPPMHALSQDVLEKSYQDAFDEANQKVATFRNKIEADPGVLAEIVLSSSRAKEDRIKGLAKQLEDPNQREVLVEKMTDQLYNQNFTPRLPRDIFEQNLQDSINKGKLGLVNTATSYGEVLFLSTEDYHAERLRSQTQISQGEEEAAATTTTESNDDNEQIDMLPIPPFVKHFYISPPFVNNIEGKGASQKLLSIKQNIALDLICQLKLRPLRQQHSKMEYLDSDLKQVDIATSRNQTKMTNSSSYNISDMQDIDALAQSAGLLNSDVASQIDAQMMKVNGVNKQASSPKALIAASYARDIAPGTILVFFNPFREDDMTEMFHRLSDTGLRVGFYCSKSDRHQRYQVLSNNEHLDVILANDTLSRGIDFKAVSTVINLDTPRTTTTFIHRSGRAGRVGGKFRKAARVINIVDAQPTNNTTENAHDKQVQAPRGSDTSMLIKHAQKSNLTINPWPYVVPYNLSTLYLRSLKSIMSETTERHGIKRHLDRARATENYIKMRNVKLHKMGIVPKRKSDVFLPEGYRDSQFQPQKMSDTAKKVAIHDFKTRTATQLRGNNSQAWTKIKNGNKRGLKH